VSAHSPARSGLSSGSDAVAEFSSARETYAKAWRVIQQGASSCARRHEIVEIDGIGRRYREGRLCPRRFPQETLHLVRWPSSSF